MKTLSWISLSMLACCTLNISANAQVPENLKDIPVKYDRNENGIVEKGPELNTYLLHKRNSILEKYDADLDGKLSINEIQFLNDTFLDDDLKDDIYDAEEYLGDNRGIAVNKAVEKDSKPAMKKCYIDNKATLLRSAYFTPSVFGSLPKKDKASLQRVTPATFSFSRNNLNDNDTLVATGALSFVKHRVYTNCLSQNIGNVLERALSTGLVFDRSSSSDPNVEGVDSLAFNLNADFFIQGWPVFDSHNVTGSVAFLTDFDFSSAVLSSSINWQPTHNSIAIGVARQIGDLPLSFRWQPRLELNYQTILNAGAIPALMEEDDSIFVSPSVTAQVFLENDVLEGVFLEINYQYWQDILDASGSLDYFEGSINIPLDTSQHFLIQARYREGNLPSSRQAVDDYLLGFGVRF